MRPRAEKGKRPNEVAFAEVLVWPLFRSARLGASVASAEPGGAGVKVLGRVGAAIERGLRSAEIELSTQTKHVLDAGEGSER